MQMASSRPPTRRSSARAIQLGWLPRLAITQTSAVGYGQIYVGPVNWLLMVVTIGLTVGFGKSDNLAAAYGIAVSLTMLMTTMLLTSMIGTSKQPHRKLHPKGGHFEAEGWGGPCGVNEVTCHVSGYGSGGVQFRFCDTAADVRTVVSG